MDESKRSVEKEKRRAYWRGIVEEAERSGASIRVFCQQRRVKEHRFYRWRQTLEREGRAAAKAPAEAPFVLVRPNTGRGAAEDGELELVLDRGWRLRMPRGADESTLRGVLAALHAAR